MSRCLKLHQKETPAQVFSWEFCVVFRRTLFTEYFGWLLLLIAWFQPVLFSDYTFSFFPLFYTFITDNCNYGSLFREGIKMKIFFTFKNNLSKNYHVVRENIRENTHFLLGKASEIAECRGEFWRLWPAQLGSKKKAIWATQVPILNWMNVHQSSTVL